MHASEHGARDVTPAPAPAADARPDGPAAAALLAAGIGSLALAIFVVWAEASESFKESLAYSEDVGPLAGKTLWAVGIYLVSWLVLSVVLRRRDVSLRTAGLITAVLLALAFLGTFSPFFEMFASE